MLNGRIYRVAFLPLAAALLIAAFSLGSRPEPLTATLAPDAFDGDRAARELRALAERHPERRAGSDGDRALAREVAGTFRASGFAVVERHFRGETADGMRDLTTVVGVRVGVSSRRLVVMSHRDSLASPGTAELSGTAGLLELARVFAGRRLEKTLVLVSTSGGSGGGAGAREFAENASDRIDAALVLGDLAGGQIRKPWVVPWSNDAALAPLRLRRTVQAAVRAEVDQHAGGPRASAQVARLAAPLTPGEQGELLGHGIPAVLLSISGERGPGVAGADEVFSRRLRDFGRSALRSLTALDGAEISAWAPEQAVVVQGRLLQPWVIRLLGACLLLPVLLGAIDAFARARRRRHPVAPWLVRVIAAALPLALAAALAVLLDLVGLLRPAPPIPLPPEAAPEAAARWAAVGAVALAAVLGWLVLRPMVLRAAGVPRDADDAAAGTALGLALGALGALAWVVNPFAALVLLPAVHLWFLATVAPRPRGAAVVLVALGAALPVLVGAAHARALGWGPAELPWSVVQLVGGRHVAISTTLAATAWIGVLAVAVPLALRGAPPPAPVPRPGVKRSAGYAGPGSLGGTPSALRR